MTDVVAVGTPDDPDDLGPVSYAIGPTQLQRLLKTAVVPPALGLTSLLIALATLTVTNPVGEIASTYAEVHNSQTTLVVYRWESGLRAGLALVALALAIVGLAQVLGRRPQVTIPPEDLDADPATLDALEAEALAAVPAPPAWVAMVLGAGVLFSVVSLIVNVAVFAYALSSHLPPANHLQLL